MKIQPSDIRVKIDYEIISVIKGILDYTHKQKFKSDKGKDFTNLIQNSFE